MHKLSITETAQAAWSVVRYNWVAFLKMGLGLILAYVGVIVLVVVTGAAVFATRTGGMAGAGPGLLVFLTGFVAIAVVIAFYIPYAVNVHLFALAVASGRAPEPAPMIRWRRNEWVYLLWAFLLGLGVTVVTVIFVAIFMAVFGSALASGGRHSIVAAVGAVIAGFVVFVVMAIAFYYLWARFSFLFIEAAKLGEANAARSWRQTAFSHMQIFLALVVTYLPFFGVQTLLQIISAPMPVALQYVIFAIGIPVSFFGMVAVLVCMALSYHDQVEQQH